MARAVAVLSATLLLADVARGSDSRIRYTSRVATLVPAEPVCWNAGSRVTIANSSEFAGQASGACATLRSSICNRHQLSLSTDASAYAVRLGTPSGRVVFDSGYSNIYRHPDLAPCEDDAGVPGNGSYRVTQSMVIPVSVNESGVVEAAALSAVSQALLQAAQGSVSAAATLGGGRQDVYVDAIGWQAGYVGSLQWPRESVYSNDVQLVTTGGSSMANLSGLADRVSLSVSETNEKNPFGNDTVQDNQFPFAGYFQDIGITEAIGIREVYTTDQTIGPIEFVQEAAVADIALTFTPSGLPTTKLWRVDYEAELPDRQSALNLALLMQAAHFVQRDLHSGFEGATEGSVLGPGSTSLVFVPRDLSGWVNLGNVVLSRPGVEPVTTTSTGTTATTTTVATTASTTTTGQQQAAELVEVVATTLSDPVLAGATALRVAAQEGFRVGDEVTISGGGRSETRSIASVGSIVLTEPLEHDYPAGSSVVRALPSLQPVPGAPRAGGDEHAFAPPEEESAFLIPVVASGAAAFLALAGAAGVVMTKRGRTKAPQGKGNADSSNIESNDLEIDGDVEKGLDRVISI